MGELDTMRLHNIYYLCKQCESDISHLQFNRSGGGYSILEWEHYKQTLFVLRQVEFIKSNVDSLYDTVPVFVREKETPLIDDQTRERLIAIKKELLVKMRTVISLYESMGLPESDEGVDVKIPTCNSLSEYISYLKELDFIFGQCPFLRTKEGSIEFKNVDVGSQWISFCIATTVGTGVATCILGNLATLVDKAIQIKSHIKTLREQEEVLRSRKMQSDVLESTLEVFNELKKHYISEAVDQMENEDNQLKDGEERGKAEKSLEKLSMLLDKGVEIYASIGTDKKIQVLFPTVEKCEGLPEETLKFLEEKSLENKS